MLWLPIDALPSYADLDSLRDAGDLAARLGFVGDITDLRDITDVVADVTGTRSD